MLGAQQMPSPAVERLRYEFSSRMGKNHYYSLRAFARFLGVSHSLLSLILSGKRNPSENVKHKMSEKFGLNPKEAQEIFGIDASKKPKKKTKQHSLFKGNFKLTLDQFAFLSEWQHYSILSLLEIADTDLSVDFISKRLRISKSLAKVSLKRLFEMNMIKKDKVSGRWRQSTRPIVVENTESTVHTRQFQRQLITKALDSMENDPMPVRDLSSTTFAMDPKLVPYALKRIREFRRALTIELEEMGNPEEVYNLTVQLFPTSYRGPL